MAHVDWLIILPSQGIHFALLGNQSRKNIVQIKFESKLKFFMPHSDDKEHSPSEFYYPGETNDPNIYT